MAQVTWKVFWPKSSWSLPSGIVIGVINHEQSSVTVTAIVQRIMLKQPIEEIQDLKRHLRDTDVDIKTTSSDQKFEVVGLLIPENEVATLKVNSLDGIFREARIVLIMQKTRICLQPECLVMKRLRSNTWSNVNSLMFLAYDSSVEYQAHSLKAPALQDYSKNSKLVDQTLRYLRNWNLFKECCNLKQFKEIELKNCSFFRGLFNFVLMIILQMIKLSLNSAARLLNLLLSPKLFRSWIVDSVISWPATGCQLKKKYRHLQEWAILNRTKQDVNREMNLLLLLLIDFALGIVLLTLLHQIDFSNILATAFMEVANNTAVSLEELLRWLMGAPAGLKLNRELASFLGQFFLYHIYLWIGYLGTITPFLAVAIKFTSLCGCLGLSVFIALASDVLSILTFHIYCFYVYAARIYCLQVHGLMAFWRLFRGKKWNVLRQRVDSSSFRVDQLFLGTLLFTILLFLLPTTTVFYSVFTVMRLLVLVPQSVVAKIIAFLNRIPFYSLLLWTLRAGYMVDGITFYPVPRNPHHTHGWLLLKMKTMSLTKVMAVSALDSKHTDENTWRSLGLDLICGYLVYPWGGKLKEHQNAIT